MKFTCIKKCFCMNQVFNEGDTVEAEKKPSDYFKAEGENKKPEAKKAEGENKK